VIVLSRRLNRGLTPSPRANMADCAGGNSVFTLIIVVPDAVLFGKGLPGSFLVAGQGEQAAAAGEGVADGVAHFDGDVHVAQEGATATRGLAPRAECCGTDDGWRARQDCYASGTLRGIRASAGAG
jgi:hypothetical protein